MAAHITARIPKPTLPAVAAPLLLQALTCGCPTLAATPSAGVTSTTVTGSRSTGRQQAAVSTRHPAAVSEALNPLTNVVCVCRYHSVDQYALIDNPAMIDKALEVSGATKLAFVGHSQVWDKAGSCRGPCNKGRARHRWQSPRMRVLPSAVMPTVHPSQP